MSPLLGILGLAVVFVGLVVLMLGREGPKDARSPVPSPDLSARNSLARMR